MKIAIDWKIVEHYLDGADIKVRTKRLGHFTAATAREKMATAFPEYTFVAKGNHGFGGYWVHINGNTAECIPS